MTPRDVHILIPRACNCVTFYGKRALADVMNLRTLGSEDNLGLSGRAQYNHKGLYKKHAEGSE